MSRSVCICIPACPLGDDNCPHVVSSTEASWFLVLHMCVSEKRGRCLASATLGCVQVREEAQAVALKCSTFIRVSSLAVDSAAVQRDIFLHIGQVVVSTPGQVAQVLPPQHLG